MKNFLNTTFVKPSFVFLLSAMSIISCNRADDTADDLPQEEISNVVLVVKDEATGASKFYDYQINGSKNPEIQLTNGHSYEVSVNFMNGAENTNSEIAAAKDEHFLIYNFPNSDIALTRTDDASTTRKDGAHVGMKTKWVVNQAVKNTAAPATLILTLYHQSKTVTETVTTSGNNVFYGGQTGGNTDAVATYILRN